MFVLLPVTAVNPSQTTKCGADTKNSRAQCHKKNMQFMSTHTNLMKFSHFLMKCSETVMKCLKHKDTQINKDLQTEMRTHINKHTHTHTHTHTHNEQATLRRPEQVYSFCIHSGKIIQSCRRGGGTWVESWETGEVTSELGDMRAISHWGASLVSFSTCDSRVKRRKTLAVVLWKVSELWRDKIPSYDFYYSLLYFLSLYNIAI